MPPSPVPSNSERGSSLYDVTLRVTVRAYDDADAQHIAALYRDRVEALTTAWPVKLVVVEHSTRRGI